MLFTVPVIYCIILIYALRNVKSLKNAKPVHDNKITSFFKQFYKSSKPPELRCNKKDDTIITCCQTIEELNVNKLTEYKERASSNNSETNNYCIESNVKKKKPSDEKLFKLSRNLSAKCKEPSEWRAIKVVMLTSFTFLITLAPFALVQLSYISCKYRNTDCEYLTPYLTGPLGILASSNSALNPIIYAWWHKGFKTFIKQKFLRIYNKLKK